jgi:anti-sigma B factor antagonist
MRIGERVSGDVIVIEPKERLTIETEPEFASYFVRLLEAGHKNFALSLADVPYIDSVGLGAIVRAYTSARRRGGDLKLVHVEGKNRHLLEITRLLTVLHEDRSEREVAQ